MGEQQDLLVQARQLTCQLEEAYARFRRRSEELAESRRAAKRGLAGLLRGLFSTPQPVDPEHERFLSEVERLSAQLAQALEPLPASTECQEMARRAVACMLAPKPLENKSPEEWFMTAAEIHCLPLLPLLSREDLEGFHAAMEANVPKRYRFPRQQEVFRRLEELVSSHPA